MSIDVASQLPSSFAAKLRGLGVRRGYLISTPLGVEASHPALADLVPFLATPASGFAQHEGIFFATHERYDMLLGAFVHKTRRGQAQGGTRLWQYDDLAGFLRDGLRLAQGMTRKNALAGLWWGGGKGVIAHDPKVDRWNADYRHAVFTAYGELTTSLGGCYVTAEDVGVTTPDMKSIHAATRFVTCVPPAIGGSGDPSPSTARGVLVGMQEALATLGMGSLAGKTVAVQGVGAVGGPLIRYLVEAGVGRVIAADVSDGLVAKRKTEWAGMPVSLRVCSSGDDSILFEAAEVVAPCALGATINARTIPQLKARVVCGAANNQLEDAERDGRALLERGITYVPDFLVNRMGIVNCANEQYGYVTPDPMRERHFTSEWEYSIPRMTRAVLAESAKTGVSTDAAARRLADALAEETHPIFGHRGAAIIASLVRDGWAAAT